MSHKVGVFNLGRDENSHAVYKQEPPGNAAVSVGGVCNPKWTWVRGNAPLGGYRRSVLERN